MVITIRVHNNIPRCIYIHQSRHNPVVSFPVIRGPAKNRPNLPVISDSWDREPPKNSWRSLDCSGNGYLGVYEGGAGRVARGYEGGIHLAQVQTKGQTLVEKGRGVDSAETVRKAPQEDAESIPSPPLFLEEKNKQSSAGAGLRRSQRTLLLSFCLKPKYNSQSNAVPFLDRVPPRHIGRARENATGRRVGTPCVPG